jgi:hypothetical protein
MTPIHLPKLPLEHPCVYADKVKIHAYKQDLVTEHDQSHAIMAVKNARVSDFGGRSLSTTRSSMVEMNPDMQQAHHMRGWYDMQVHGQHHNITF